MKFSTFKANQNNFVDYVRGATGLGEIAYYVKKDIGF
jgi:hypothetical protein